MKRHPALRWVLAIALTLLAAAWQRASGPTHPRAVTFGEGDAAVATRLPRSHPGDGGCDVEIEVADASVGGFLWFRRYPTDEPWTRLDLAGTATSSAPSCRTSRRRGSSSTASCWSGTGRSSRPAWAAPPSCASAEPCRPRS
jgi:hypothetical protein